MITVSGGGISRTVSVSQAAGYLITYNANGGTGAPGNQIKTHGIDLTLSSTKPERVGYTFLGWSTNNIATTATYREGGLYTANAQALLFAVWKLGPDENTSFANALTISLNTPMSVNIRTAYEKRYYSFTAPTTGSYIFESSNNTGDPYGWLYSSTQALITSNDDISITNRNFRITSNLIANQRYYIVGGCFSNGTGNYTLKVTAPATYIISYNANGGTGAPPTPTPKTQGISATLSQVAPTRAGFTFLGWSEDRNATAATYRAGDPFTKDATVTLYAVWASNNGTSFSTATQIFTNNPAAVTISTSSEKRYFYFIPPATGSYTFESFNNTGDPYGWLYNERQTLITQNDDIDGATNRNFRITDTLTGGEKYYIVGGCFGVGTGNYSIRVNPAGPAYTATVNNRFDAGYSVFHRETSTQSANMLNNYMAGVADRYMSLFGLKITYSSASGFTSMADSCKGNVNELTIGNLCSHRAGDVDHCSRDEICKDFSNKVTAGNNTTNVLWTGHRVTSYSTANQYQENRSMSNDTSILMLELSLTTTRLIDSQGILMHELNHQYGGKDHYHELRDRNDPYSCKFRSICSECQQPGYRPTSCVMYDSRINITNANVICEGCKNDILSHLNNHHR